MTYTVSSGTLNSTIPYHTIRYRPGRGHILAAARLQLVIINVVDAVLVVVVDVVIVSSSSPIIIHDPASLTRMTDDADGSSIIRAGADLTGGHSCRRGPWEVGPWRPRASKRIRGSTRMRYINLLLLTYLLTYLLGAPEG